MGEGTEAWKAEKRATIASPKARLLRSNHISLVTRTLPPGARSRSYCLGAPREKKGKENLRRAQIDSSVTLSVATP